ncbi:hypothetical protein AVEN_259931-1 [Araneus ventricosus]|uniref:Uncharacterized protein n=1 Tax=Araneus ventricosus TaxID=182803 RepID=A0A4Y2GPR5_ARAVE|nr:hypothetical protein AVEN_259931-1 [Araneus ventricosus]
MASGVYDSQIKREETEIGRELRDSRTSNDRTSGAGPKACHHLPASSPYVSEAASLATGGAQQMQNQVALVLGWSRTRSGEVSVANVNFFPEEEMAGFDLI